MNTSSFDNTDRQHVDESFLRTLLQYRAPLISQEFINSTLTKIEAAQQKRRWILMVAAILGFLIAWVSMLQSWPVLTSLFYIFSSSTYAMAVFSLGFLSVGTWLFVTVFE